MRERFGYFSWWQSSRGATALLFVLTTGFLLGYYGWLAVISPPTRTFRLDFGPAHWIQSSQPGNNICFRKNIYLHEAPRHAWLQITGVDEFRLFVNGKHAGVTSKVAKNDPTILSLFRAGNQSVICDITELLTSGTNTIAINATRGSFPGKAKLICRGGITESGGVTEFFSDTSWRVSVVPGTIPSLVSWINPTFDDSSWPHAEEASIERSRFNQPVPVPPVLLQEPIQGKWIIDEHPEPGGNTTFQRHFEAIKGDHDVWLQIAATGAYSVIFNGRYLGAFDDAEPTVRLFDIRHWIRTGRNELSVQVQTPGGSPAIISEISFLSEGAKVGAIPSGHDWRLPHSRHATVIGAYNYSGDRWGPPAKMNMPMELPNVETTWQHIQGLSFMLALAGLVLLAWMWFGRFLSKRNNSDSERILAVDAALHLPTLVAAATLLLLRYDIRLRPEAPINCELFLGLVVLLIISRLLVFFPTERKAPASVFLQGRDEWWRWLQRYSFWVALGLIVIGGFAIRLRDLTTFPLDQDDILIRNYAQGIFERGFPSLDFYGYVIPVTTYELLPYPIALSCLFFGWSDWAVLLPSLIFGTMTILLVGLMGRNLFDWRVGLSAALIQAFNPLNVFWSQHCFHPSQDQFFAVLTIWSFYLAIREPGKLHVRYFYGACFAFILTYLSWEGVGFLLPIMAGALMLMHPGRFAWLRQRHLWIGLIVVGSVVLIQLSLRKMAAPGFIFLGYGLALLGGPQLYFLNPQSTPFYYVSNFLLTAPLLPLTILSALGALFAWKNSAVRYCLVIFAALLTAFSLCMPVYSIRYFYFYEFLLPLIGCGVFFILWDRTRELIIGWRLAYVPVLAATSFLLLLVFGITTETKIKAFRLSERMEPSLRYGVVRQDTRSPAQYVARHLRPGDIVLANLTQALYLYGERLPDFALNTLLASRMIYLNEYGSYRHRFVGVPMVRNLRDVNNIFAQGRRLWYIGGGSITMERSELRDAMDYLTQHSKVVYSSYHTKVYLWNGTVTPADQTVINPALPPQPNLIPEKPDPLDIVEEAFDDSAPDEPIFDAHVSQATLYPQWTHQKIGEPDPGRKNAAEKVQPLQPPPKPEKANSDE